MSQSTDGTLPINLFTAFAAVVITVIFAYFLHFMVEKPFTRQQVKIVA